MKDYRRILSRFCLNNYSTLWDFYDKKVIDDRYHFFIYWSEDSGPNWDIDYIEHDGHYKNSTFIFEYGLDEESFFKEVLKLYAEFDVVKKRKRFWLF